MHVHAFHVALPKVLHVTNAYRRAYKHETRCSHALSPARPQRDRARQR